jgi:hypothetical protein
MKQEFHNYFFMHTNKGGSYTSRNVSMCNSIMVLKFNGMEERGNYLFKLKNTSPEKLNMMPHIHA